MGELGLTGGEGPAGPGESWPSQGPQVLQTAPVSRAHADGTPEVVCSKLRPALTPMHAELHSCNSRRLPAGMLCQVQAAPMVPSQAPGYELAQNTGP